MNRSGTSLTVLLLTLAVAFASRDASDAGSDSDSDSEIYDTQRIVEPLLSPEEARESIELPPGFEVTVFAAEPDVRQPIAMAFDERGRLWVAENYTYAERARNFDERLHDRILILEDTDGDGRSDRRKVFWDRGSKLASVEVGFGGVWALCAPRLLFIPDRDRDDVPDGDPVTLLDGWEDDRVRHNLVNGLRWGPDGWLYGRHGIQGTSYVGRPGEPREDRTPINCGIWRFHPERHAFEVVARGTTNPWGHDWDDHGQLFFINTVIGHLWHVVPGAHYQRMYGEDFNPHLYELIPQTADHYHWDTREKWSDVRKLGVTETSSRAGGGHAHAGLMVYLGDDWPEEYRGDVFTLNFHGRRINRDHLERRGAGYVGRHRPDLLHVGDVWFRGLDLIYGPDGGVYVSDWSDIGECHESDGVHRTSGRIYKVTHGPAKRPEVPDLATLSGAELVELQLHQNDWWVRQARRVLHERAARGDDLLSEHAALRRIFREKADVTRKLRALWSLHVTGGTDESFLATRLAHPEEHVRVWAVTLLVDRGAPSPEALEALEALAERETSGLVRLFLASALQKLPHAKRWEIARSLAGRADLAGDPVFPLMLWYGIEPAVPGSPVEAVELARSSLLPKPRRFIARRLASGLAARPEPVDRLLRLLVDEATEEVRLDILEGLVEELRGWRRAEPPPAWKRVSEMLARSSNERVRQLARELAVVFGEGRAIDELRRVAASSEEPMRSRRRAIEALVRARVEDIRPLLEELLSVRELAAAAVAGLATFGKEGTAEVLVEVYPRLRRQGREAVIRALASRPSWARRLLESVAAGRIPDRDVPLFYVRQMRSLDDPEVRRRLDELFPAVANLPAEKEKALRRYRRKLAPEKLRAIDMSAGAELWTKVCGSCHKLFGEGGEVGPDLTGSNRSDLEYLLVNLIDPAAEVADDYRTSTVVLADGRVLSGIVGRETDRTIALQTPEEKLVLPKSDVLEIESSGASLMPEGLLDTLSGEEARNLIGYLMRAKGAGQVTGPTE